MEYTKKEAKDWAKEKFRGLENCLFPSFTPDMSALDEKGIRLDVQQSIKHGFFSTLIIPDAGTTLEETKRFIEIVVDEAKEKIFVCLWITFNTFDLSIEMLKFAESVGADSALLGYPPSYYPKSEEAIYQVTKQMCDSTNIAINLYPSHKQNFERFHNSTFDPRLLDRMCDIENVVGMKMGVTDPGFMFQCFHLFGEKIMAQTPSLSMFPLLVGKYGQKWGGAANYEALQSPDKPLLVKHFNLLLEGEMDKAMDLYWELTPARTVWEEYIIPTVVLGTYHYPQWKYNQWLVGGNGGSLRLPVMRLYEHDKERYKAALRTMGITPREPEAEYYEGRVNYSG